eukprot:275881-Hanusia_phi.AAC.1
MLDKVSRRPDIVQSEEEEVSGWKGWQARRTRTRTRSRGGGIGDRGDGERGGVRGGGGGGGFGGMEREVEEECGWNGILTFSLSASPSMTVGTLKLYGDVEFVKSTENLIRLSLPSSPPPPSSSSPPPPRPPRLFFSSLLTPPQGSYRASSQRLHRFNGFQRTKFVPRDAKQRHRRLS